MRGGLTRAALLCVSLCPCVAHASGADLFGFGPRSLGMAGAGAALGAGIDVTYANPALLGLERVQSAYVGWQLAHFELTAKGSSAAAEQDPSSSFLFGAVVPLPLHGPLERRVSLGIGALLPKSVITRVRLLWPERPQFPLLVPRAHNLNLNLGLGVRLDGGWTVGAGILVAAGLMGQVDVNMGEDGKVRTIVDDELLASFAPTLGGSWQASEAIRIGLAYRGRLTSDFDMRLSISNLGVPVPPGSIVLPEMYVAGVAQIDPAQLQGEVSWQVLGVQLAAGVTWRRWSPFKGWLRQTVRCPGERPDCGALEAPRVELSNTVTPRLALAYPLGSTPRAQAELRAGYAYEPSPLAAQNGRSNLWDNARHVFALGYGLRLRGPVRLCFEFAVQQHTLVARQHVKSASVPLDNPGQPRVRTAGHVLVVAAGAGVDF